MDIQPKMQSIINTYYSNEAKELHKMVDKVLKNLHFTEVDTEDFYCLDCLADYLECSTEDLKIKIREFKEQGCSLFL